MAVCDDRGGRNTATHIQISQGEHTVRMLKHRQSSHKITQGHADLLRWHAEFQYQKV